MKVYLGIHAGHNSSAALMVDGQIKVAVQEERFSKVKNHGGYPKHSIDFCLEYLDENELQLDRVAFSTIELSGFWAAYPIHHYYSVKDYHDHYGSAYYGPKLNGDDLTSYYKKIVSEVNKITTNSHLNFEVFETIEDLINDTDKFRELLKEYVSKQCSIALDKVDFLDHHTCHAYYAFFGSDKNDKACNVITIDSFGDGLNQTLWYFGRDRVEKLRSTDQCDIGRIYKITTLILGMKPDEHEFKVMGMDPYAKPEYVDKVYKDVYEPLLKVEDGKIIHNERPDDLYQYLSEKLKPYRFDNIAGAVQKFVEVLMSELISQSKDITGLSSFCLSGGVSMNIKMNMVISELPEVDSIYVPASGSDESLSIGACFYLNGFESKFLPNTYLGNNITDRNIQSDLKKFFPEDKCIIEEGISHSKVAQIFADGGIVAAVRGREEFGARALGNRSILANPNDPEVIKVINEMIKNRDFWMPFALSIMEEEADSYFINPKGIISRYMTLGFRTLDKNYPRIKAGTHPYDRTCRPQFVSKKFNQEYHSLINEFFKLTGTPGLLNTSLNLHGYPICSNLEDVSFTFFNSSLPYVYINDNYLISKK